MGAAGASQLLSPAVADAVSKKVGEPSTSLDISIIFALQLCFSVVLGHLLHQTKYKYATEGAIALLIGLVAGGSVFAMYTCVLHRSLPEQLYNFNTDTFFNVLLPPIIFNAGFSMKKKLFFQNFTTIASFGIVGTFVSWGIVSAGSWYALGAMDLASPASRFRDSVALGTIFSSTDTVATLQVLKADQYPMLHSLVFGEGVINDASSLVLLRAVETMSSWQALSARGLRMMLLRFGYLFAASLLLGIGVGLLSAALILYLFRSAHSTDSEVLLLFVLGFLAYSVAEALGLSGIFAVFFCGVTMSHYTWHSLSPSAKVVTVYAFRILSFSVELFLFIYCGFDVFSIANRQAKLYTQGWVLCKVGALAAALMALVVAARGVFVMPLAALANTWRNVRISWREAVAVWWAGAPP